MLRFPARSSPSWWPWPSSGTVCGIYVSGAALHSADTAVRTSGCDTLSDVTARGGAIAPGDGLPALNRCGPGVGEALNMARPFIPGRRRTGRLVTWKTRSTPIRLAAICTGQIARDHAVRWWKKSARRPGSRRHNVLIMGATDARLLRPRWRDRAGKGLR